MDKGQKTSFAAIAVNRTSRASYWVYVSGGTSHRLFNRTAASLLARRSRRASVASCGRTGRFPTRLTWTVDHWQDGTWVGRSQSHQPPAWLLPAAILETESRVNHE